MLLLTDKLNLKCYVFYQTKELLTITKMLITIINILSAIVIIIIIIITKKYYYSYNFFISNKLTNCVGLPETTVNKRFTVLALEIIKDNQNRVKVESNILLMRSKQQKKWKVFRRSSHHPNVIRKKSVLKY